MRGTRKYWFVFGTFVVWTLLVSAVMLGITTRCRETFWDLNGQTQAVVSCYHPSVSSFAWALGFWLVGVIGISILVPNLRES